MCLGGNPFPLPIWLVSAVCQLSDAVVRNRDHNRDKRPVACVADRLHEIEGNIDLRSWEVAIIVAVSIDIHLRDAFDETLFACRIEGQGA
jgi:hypothetical protein